MEDFAYAIGNGVCSLVDLFGGGYSCPTQAETVLAGYMVFAALVPAIAYALFRLRGQT